MRIFKTKWLVRYARRERITDRSLSDAIERAARGLIDADLGGGIIKQRVAREGQGRSGGYRMLVAYRAGARAVFLYAFAKNERENIGSDELLTWREIGAGWLAANAQQIARACRRNFAGGQRWRKQPNLAAWSGRCWRRPTTCGAPASWTR